jgi:segregation and condensation protein A
MIEPADPDLLPPAKPHAADQPATEAGDEGGFTVHLERVFHGPLDLLLQLVRDKELEIHLVALADVCDAYCEHVRTLKDVDVDEAADYLVVAATLLAIKSRSLLPQEELDVEEDPFDPGEELVQQLLAYKELRRVAEQLADARERRARRMSAGGRWLGRPPADTSDEEEDEEWDLGDVSVWDLLRVIGQLEEETGFLRPHRVRPTGRPLHVYVEELWHRLQRSSATSLRGILREAETPRPGDAAYYLVALLELAKQQQVDLSQDRPFADVLVQRVEGAGELHLEDLDADFDKDFAQHDSEVDELIGEEPL